MGVNWAVRYDHGTAFVRGPKAEARRRIAACGDPNPIWVKRREAWATSPAVAHKVMGQLEAWGATVPVEDAQQGELTFTETVPANHTIRQQALW